MTTTASAAAENFLVELSVRFPDLDWPAIMNAKGDRSLQEVADWAIAAGVDAESVTRLMAVGDGYLKPAQPGRVRTHKLLAS